MSVLEQYTYDGSRKPDFQTLPTLVVPDEAMPVDVTEASGSEGEDKANQIREQLKEKAKANLVEIGRLQRALHAAKKRGLIVILQGMPYSGRTETNQYLKKAMKGGVKIYSYRKGESTHDFLWQMHKKTPKYGNICLMNSSVYADVPETEGGAERVRAFEKYLKASGISVVRIFLHVSSNRQKKRMLEVITTKPGGAPREMPKDKGWRKEYLERFAEVIAAATPETPWYVIPADSKWYARCLVTEIVRDALRECVGSDEPISVEEQVEAIEEMVPEIVEAEVVEEAAVEEGPVVVEAAVSENTEAEESVSTENVTVETESEAAEKTAAIEEVTAVEEIVAEAAPAEEPAAPEDAPADPEKKPARRTRKKKAETETPSETETAEKKPAARRQRRQGAPKTVEETLARRRKRMGSD